MPPRCGLRMTRERSERSLRDERVLKLAIRLVLIRLGVNRDVRDLIVRMCLPNGTTEEPFVLD